MLTDSTFELRLGSCLEQEADVIVNAANPYLLAGGGICGAIFTKAGYQELTRACQQYQTPLPDGEAVLTPSFQISNAKGIIHAVGPDFRKTPDAYDKLFDAYYNSLLLAKENGYSSIAFPLLSAGIYRGNLVKPAYLSASQCYQAYTKFILEYPDSTIHTILCAFTTQEYEEAKEALENACSPL